MGRQLSKDGKRAPINEAFLTLNPEPTQKTASTAGPSRRHRGLKQASTAVTTTHYKVNDGTKSVLCREKNNHDREVQ